MITANEARNQNPKYEVNPELFKVATLPAEFISLIEAIIQLEIDKNPTYPEVVFNCEDTKMMYNDCGIQKFSHIGKHVHEILTNNGYIVDMIEHQHKLIVRW